MEPMTIVNELKRKVRQAERESGGGICIWHKYSPEQVSQMYGLLLDLETALEEKPSAVEVPLSDK